MAQNAERCMDVNVMNPCKIVLAGGLVFMNDGMIANPSTFSTAQSAIISERTIAELMTDTPKTVRPRASAKKHLAAAKASKKDEFYTQYKDIARELDLYFEFDQDTFRDKVVFLPCDEPTKSNFTKYFLDNFLKFGLKRLVCSCYRKDGHGRVLVVERDDVEAGKVDEKFLEGTAHSGDGDFRSDEVKNLRDKSDIIVTNPPFSLFREFFTWIMEAKKKFLIIGSVNCISYKEIYPYIMKNEIWLGHGIGRWISGFIVPEDYDLYGTETSVDENGTHIIASNSCLWLTNLDHGRRHEPLRLMTEKDNIEKSRHKNVRGLGYKKYDNCDAIEVPHTDSIPSDYKGLMGVPITFLDKYCPEQFELVRFRKGDDGKDLRIDGKAPYFRILIRHR